MDKTSLVVRLNSHPTGSPYVLSSCNLMNNDVISFLVYSEEYSVLS